MRGITPAEEEKSATLTPANQAFCWAENLSRPWTK